MIVMVLPLAAGCGLFQPPKAFAPVSLSVADIQPKIDYSDLAAALDGATDGAGMLIPERINKQADRLEAQLRLLAVAGPTAAPQLLPGDDDRLAYWYNARCAWSIRLAMLADLPKTLPAAGLEDRPFPIDGRTMTLRQIDEALFSLAGWRAEVTAPGMLLQRARPLKEPVSAADVRSTIQDRLGQFIEDGKRFVIDVEGKSVLVPPVLWRHGEDLVRQYRAQYGAEHADLPAALRTYVTGPPHRRLQDAVGYSCRCAEPKRDLALKKK